MDEAWRQKVDLRLKDLETWQSDERVNKAVQEEQRKHLDERFTRLDTAIGELKGYFSKLVWLIISAIAVAILTQVVGVPV